MEVVLFEEGKIPDTVAKRLYEIEKNVGFPYSRTTQGLIKHIKNIAIPIDRPLFGARGIRYRLKKNPEDVFVCKNSVGSGYTYYSMSRGSFTSFKIVNIDTTKGWSIEVVDGFESITYVSNWVCVDRRKNLWVKVKE